MTIQSGEVRSIYMILQWRRKNKIRSIKIFAFEEFGVFLFLAEDKTSRRHANETRKSTFMFSFDRLGSTPHTILNLAIHRRCSTSEDPFLG